MAENEKYRDFSYFSPMIIDLRSDTVTKPTPGMLDAMMSAEVGDDVFGEDPTVNALEEKCASLFGKEAALFCPSGTMTNQIGINILTSPYEEVICYRNSHIYLYEGGGIAGNSGLSFRLLDADNGRLTRDQVEAAINPDDVHFPRTSVVSLENTVNKGGGSCYDLNEIRKISRLCRDRGLGLHLDGARLFNALVARHESPSDYGRLFNTISLCLSKGLGAPVGSVLIADKSLIAKARRMRKVFGGGMRQAGFLAAAGIYALDNHVNRLEDDHRRATTLAAVLSACSWVTEVFPVETNIVIVKLKEGLTNEQVLGEFSEKNVLATGFGPGLIRFTTHLDFTDSHLEEAVKKLRPISF